MKKFVFLLFSTLFFIGCGTQTVSFSDNSSLVSTNNSNVSMNTSLLSAQGATFVTSQGNFTVEFWPDAAPKTVDNFLRLAQKDFYDGTLFHRVIEDFMIQGGDPNSKNSDWDTHGRGGPGYTFADEINDHKLVSGVLAMANSGPNTNGSQFFIVTATSTPWLDGHHTAFGRVISGMDVVLKISKVAKNQNDHPLTDVLLQDVEIIRQ